MFRILVADSLPASVLDQYGKQEGIVVDNRAGISKEELMEILPNYEGLVVRSRTKVTADVLKCGTSLKIIGRAGAGVDNIDTEEATRRGVIVMNTPGGNTIAATEHTIALLLATLRNIPPAHLSMKEGRWDRKTYMGHELYEKTVGVVGLGKIGREVAKRIKSFGTRLIGYDPILSKEMADRLGVELVSLEELLKRSDIITVHVPKMADTMNMFDKKRLAMCKDGVVIVNCARGGIINEADLIAALDSGKVSAAAVDVYPSEPPENWDLAKHPRVVSTPHLGASTEEAQTKVADQILQQMIEYHQKNVAANAVNFLSVDEKIQPLIAPYFQLGHRLGSLFSQIRDGRLKEVAIRFYGDVAKLPLEPIASHLMAGALKSVAGDRESHDVDFLNMVNSLAIARDKGVSIELTQKETPLTSHTNLIACDFHTADGMVHLVGTVYAKDIYRLVEFNKFTVDADLSDKMLIIENDDVPGIIGKAGTILGEKGINISHMSSGRVKADKAALNIFTVEGTLNKDLKKALEANPHIRSVLMAEIDS